MINNYRTTRMPVPFTPFGSTGLLEKRVRLYTQLSLIGVVGKNSAYNHYPDSDLFLDDLAASHHNHARDPGASAITLAQSATTNWSRSRALPDALALTDHAHAYLLGLGGGGGGSGDPDLSKHTALFDDTAVTGQPVRVTGNNTVGLANADVITTSNAVGLVLTGATSGNSGEYLTEGSVDLADWTLVIGATSLVPGSDYYLSDAAPGLLSDTAPVTRGSCVVHIGTALSTTKMDIEINVDILL